MPIYEYKCRANGHIFEARQAFKDPEIEACEVCQSPVDRLVSASAFHLKGTGWYTTDYKGGSKSGTVEKPAEKSAEVSTEKKEVKASSELKSESPKKTET